MQFLNGPSLGNRTHWLIIGRLSVYVRCISVKLIRNVVLFLSTIFSSPLNCKIFALNSVWLQHQTCRILSVNEQSHTPLRSRFFLLVAKTLLQPSRYLASARQSRNRCFSKNYEYLFKNKCVAAVGSFPFFKKYVDNRLSPMLLTRKRQISIFPSRNYQLVHTNGFKVLVFVWFFYVVPCIYHIK